MKKINEEIENKIVEIAKKRFNTHKKSGGTLTRNEIIILLKENYENGFKCYYCKCDLKFKDFKPHKNVPSVDHLIPLSMGGRNEKENITICCARCNIVKGTMKSDTYIEFLNKIGINSILHTKIINESYKGKFANKIERVNEEKNQIVEEDDIETCFNKRLERTFEEISQSGLTINEFFQCMKEKYGEED